jgi:hypothetical protein
MCAEHKLEGMEDVVHKRCQHDGCRKAPTISTKTTGGLHKLPYRTLYTHHLVRIGGINGRNGRRIVTSSGRGRVLLWNCDGIAMDLMGGDGTVMGAPMELRWNCDGARWNCDGRGWNCDGIVIGARWNCDGHEGSHQPKCKAAWVD